ncbi:integral membrane protein [Streptomyces zinciresistens K42]|uniref:Integral membrane protein n=1 Tax=Streptomyces zinciresistens K42 TaxID=700597 RepID=G2GAY7_9ACTN|nr:hypothetical protein [Streptomyces zinciresistens]EGX59378.1 integral membrane protein [Streptomyces zinciresistens K42]
MQGHGYTQPVNRPPATGLLVFLRVLFAVVSVLSFGLLMWVMMLRLAVVTRRMLDWALLGVAIVVEFVGLVLLGSEPGNEITTAGGWTGFVLLFGGIAGFTVYYLVADIRHFRRVRLTGYGTGPAPAYGYPQPPQTPYTGTTLSQTPPTPQRPVPQTPVPNSPPPPQRPAPARIDQVRAELDELSDYLRQHDGRQDGSPESGR